MSHVLGDASSFWHRRTPSVSHRAAHELGRRTFPGPPLAAGERLLRRFTSDAKQIVATDRALYRESAAGQWLRIAWPDIALVGWSRGQHELTLRLWPSGGGHEIRIPGDAALAAFADERVAATRLLITHAEIRPGLIATVTAVRCTDDDSVLWRVVVDGHDAADDPALRDACGRLIAELRGLAGC